MLPLNEVFFGFSHFFAAWGSSLLYRSYQKLLLLVWWERGEINEEHKINGGASVECWTIYFDSYPPQELSANLVQHAIHGIFIRTFCSYHLLSSFLIQLELPYFLIWDPEVFFFSLPFIQRSLKKLVTHCAFVMNFMTHFYFNLQISHTKSFKLRPITYLYFSYSSRYS